MAGINPEWFTTMTNHNDETKRIVNKVDQMLEDETVQTSTLLQALGRAAIKKLHGLMTGSGKEEIQLKAAQDLADRSPETTKIQKHELSVNPQISSEEAKLLAKALIEGAQVHQDYKAITAGDYVKVDIDVMDKEPVNAEVVEVRAEPDAEEVSDEEADQGVHEAPEKVVVPTGTGSGA